MDEESVGPSPSCSTEPQPTASYHGDQDNPPESQEVNPGVNPGDHDNCGEIPRFNVVIKEEEEEEVIGDWTFKYTGESPVSSYSDEESRVPVQRPKNHTAKSSHRCLECGKDFLYPSKLQRHLRTHTGEKIVKKPFPCSECDRISYSAAELKMHQRMHTGERPFQCATCKKTFVFPSSLTRHEQSHISEENSTAKPYSCSECGKEFTQPWTLKIHMRQHTGEKPYHCSQCEKRFSSSSLLKRHQRVHTGEKPFECSDCGKCFSSSANRSSHRRRIHDGNAVATSQQKHATNTVDLIPGVREETGVLTNVKVKEEEEEDAAFGSPPAPPHHGTVQQLENHSTQSHL